MIKYNKYTATLVAVFFTGIAWSAAPVSDAGSSPTTIVQSSGISLPVEVTSSTANMTIEQRLARLERIISARDQAQLAQQQQLMTLSDELAEISGNLERHDYEIDQMVVRQREIYQELDRRFEQMVVDMKSQQPQTDTAIIATQSEEQSYDGAVKLVMQDHDFDSAIPAFETFLQNYPDSGYAANAHYWLGQLLYTKGQGDAASEQFLTVINQYTQSNKVSESLVKLGIIATQKGDLVTADSYFSQVISQFPNSSAADLAQGELAKLKN